MSETGVVIAPIWFWIVSGIGLSWGLLMSGVTIFEIMAAPDTLIKLYGNDMVLARPVWATAAYVVAGFGVALGCVLLLMRNDAAFWPLLAAVLAMILQNAYWWGWSEIASQIKGTAWAMPITISTVPLLLLWCSWVATTHTWLN